MLFDFLQDIDNYENRKVARLNPKDNNGIGIDTCYTSDEGFETAIFDANGTHPVERYKTKDEAITGHKKWVNKSRTLNGKRIRKLGGLGGLVADSFIKIEKL